MSKCDKTIKMDILKNIKDQLHGYITEASFEGANIVLYTDNEKFFREGGGKIKEIVEQIKKELSSEQIKKFFQRRKKQKQK